MLLAESDRLEESDFPLLGMDNVLLTPHMASRTGTALENMSWVVRDENLDLASLGPVESERFVQRELDGRAA